jgi:hypothetical protein
MGSVNSKDLGAKELRERSAVFNVRIKVLRVHPGRPFDLYGVPMRF